MISGRTPRAIAGALVLVAALALAAGGCDTIHDAVQRHETTRQTAISSEEARQIALVLADIKSGSPLPNEEDGTVFRNAEGHLPGQPLGYYREYTVPTPGSPDRGARRLVIGRNGDVWYTADHYDSFTRIEPRDYP